MKRFIWLLASLFVGLLFGCAAGQVHAVSASAVTLDLGTAVALVSLAVGIPAVIGIVFKVSAVFESLRTRLTVIENDMRHLSAQMSEVKDLLAPERPTRPPS